MNQLFSESFSNWIHFLHPERAILLIALVIVILAFVWHLITRKSQIGSFVSPAMQERLVTRPSTTSRVLQIICLAVSGIALILALMRPQIVQKESVVSARDSANIFVALDVSKSMLATDVAPNRLERAKSEIRDMLPYFSTHRVGLLAFAGRTTVLSPLTMDHGFFRLVLDTASYKSVTLGGTAIGEVIRKASSLLKEQEGPKALILISDGEDHETYPLEAAEEARRNGIVIVTVGFGSESGSTIDFVDPNSGQKRRLTDSSGAEVVSRLDSDLLKKIAMKTNGVYVPAGNGVLDLESIMDKHILPLAEESNQVQIKENRIDLFQWFVGFGLIFFAGFMLLDGKSRKSGRQLREKAA